MLSSSGTHVVTEAVVADLSSDFTISVLEDASRLAS